MLSNAQSTMRQNYVNGGPGVIISRLVWLLAAIITAVSGFQPGIISFFIGGMLIHPLSGFVEKRINPTTTAPDKKLMQLSMLTLPILFGGLYAAYTLSINNHALFYPVMAAAIGLRYVVFSRIYGLKTFIVLGLCLLINGCIGYFVYPSILFLPLTVGIIEILLGGWLVYCFKTQKTSPGV